MDDYQQGDACDSGPSFVINGVVKWFNVTKGFGFVSPSDGTGDIFLHLSCIRQSGFDGIDEGANVSCEVVRRPKGMQAIRVLEIESNGTNGNLGRNHRVEPGNGRGRSLGRPGDLPVIAANGDFQPALVKWFNPIKGYGFVSQGDGLQDVFVHMEVLRREGLSELQPGQTVNVRIGQGPKGPQVAEIKLN